jgi:peroxiredoxin
MPFKTMLISALAACLALAGAAAAYTDPLPAGSEMPAVTLPAPENDSGASYLGVEPGESFQPKDIEAKALILQIMNMYCIHCQREASRVNELYRLIQDRGLDGRLKVLAVGAQNTPYEVGLFSERYKVPFPILPDPELELHSALGERATPHFYLVDLTQGEHGKIVASHKGPLPKLEKFLESAESLTPVGK